MSDHPSTVSKFRNYAGDRILVDMSMDDARAVFADCRRDQNPVDYLLEVVADRRELKSYVRRAHISAVIFVLVLFFFRRFIP